MTDRAGIRIRPVVFADLAAVLTLYTQLNPDDPALPDSDAEARFSQMLAQPGMTVLAGFRDDVAVASVTLVVIPNLTRRGAPYALIENVVTHADHRKNGFGRAVIAHAIDLAWQAGCYKVMLLTGKKDPGVHHFYEECGFLQDKTGYQIRRPAPH